MNEVFSYTLKKVKRLIIGVVGGTIVLIGIALLVLPGPAFIVIPIGLGLLATEFVWARRLLKKVKKQIEKAAKNAKGKKSGH
jgi:uncharacterized protein (TIGR02611 family)